MSIPGFRRVCIIGAVRIYKGIDGAFGRERGRKEAPDEVPRKIL